MRVRNEVEIVLIIVCAECGEPVHAERANEPWWKLRVGPCQKCAKDKLEVKP